MTKQEVKDEWKNIEGDPKIKGKIQDRGKLSTDLSPIKCKKTV